MIYFVLEFAYLNVFFKNAYLNVLLYKRIDI